MAQQEERAIGIGNFPSSGEEKEISVSSTDTMMMMKKSSSRWPTVGSINLTEEDGSFLSPSPQGWIH